MDEGLSIVLFSGTDDKLTSAAILASGAVAMGRDVNLFLQYWALDAFQADRITKDHGFSAGVDPDAAERVAKHIGPHWSETLRMAKDIGEMTIDACAHSMELLELERDDLDPMIDNVTGIATFVGKATGQIVFI
jgi:peroxiredoxin family protein